MSLQSLRSVFSNLYTKLLSGGRFSERETALFQKIQVMRGGSTKKRIRVESEYEIPRKKELP